MGKPSCAAQGDCAVTPSALCIAQLFVTPVTVCCVPTRLDTEKAESALAPSASVPTGIMPSA